MQSVHVCGTSGRENKLEKKGMEAYLSPISASLNKVMTLAMRERSEFEKWSHKCELLRQRGSAADSVFK